MVVRVIGLDPQPGWTIGVGVPVRNVQLGGKGPSIAQAAMSIEKSGKKVSGVVFVGHGGEGLIAMDPSDPGYAQTGMAKLAEQAHVTKGGAAVAIACNVCFSGTSATEDQGTLAKRGIDSAGFDVKVGFTETGDLQVPYNRNRKGPFVSPGDVRPPVRRNKERVFSICLLALSGA